MFGAVPGAPDLAGIGDVRIGENSIDCIMLRYSLYGPSHPPRNTDRRLWPYAVRSISDWKNDYLDICRSCTVRDACGGVFTTSGNRLSQYLRPLP